MTEYQLLSGNEAIARGAYEAGVKVAAAYPGTPSTEILENLAGYDRVLAQWSPNEKVAMEVAAGASIAGARSLAAMKHVGVNVAADPLLTFSYTGVGGGMVLVSADDPAMHSSQNEQDNRYYGLLAKIPTLEPADSQEAKDFVLRAYELSETFDTPVLLRTTTRVNHSKSLVALAAPQEQILRDYEKRPEKYVMTPGNAIRRHQVVEERRLALTAFAGQTDLNRIERGRGEQGRVGFITAGISYQYLKEILPDASFLKLGLLWPLNEGLIREFAAGLDRVIVVEELEPVLETQILAMGIAAEGKAIIPRQGELSEETLRRVLAGAGLPVSPTAAVYASAQSLPPRPPILCPGCSHRGMFYTLKAMNLHVAGDIGCYALGSAPPFGCLDTTICMGASVTGAFGMELARGEAFAEKCVAVIGDSTFFHSGITGLIDIVYNQGRSTVIVLDNSITAMTGHQDNPGTGRDIKGQPAPAVDIVKLAESIGIRRIRVVDPFDLRGCRQTLAAELAAPEPSLIIARRPCALYVRLRQPPCRVETADCIGCGACLRLGCPALSVAGGKAIVDEGNCVGCGLCPQVCPKNAIREGVEA
ncbi:MAG: indolepyruvate ferredoxin oxidoreductase subunit alpha [Peptococcaceae bacterium]|jgi:indolepyruvate ferredoxin oxidoreductase alpha subunit|nr:indolepyruvate ferredoxin oxidoreductase subunit alpha [Peptococcaceae bacterium]